MKNLTLFFLTMVVIVATNTVAISQSSIRDAAPIQAPTEPRVEVVYEGAAVYDGQTSFAFVRPEGNRMFIAIHEVEREWDPKMPENMMVSGADSEGAIANPEMVGKTFLLIFGAGGDRITEVRLKD